MQEYEVLPYFIIMHYIQNPGETFTRLWRRRPHIFCGLALFNIGCCYGFDVIYDKT